MKLCHKNGLFFIYTIFFLFKQHKITPVVGKCTSLRYKHSHHNALFIYMKIFSHILIHTRNQCTALFSNTHALSKYIGKMYKTTLKLHHNSFYTLINLYKTDKTGIPSKALLPIIKILSPK